MQARLKRFDAGVARGEAAIAAFVLLSMIVLAATQAILYNLATKGELTWANDVLLELDWVDAILQKGTLWLAFLGASLATFDDKHIAVDVLSRVLPPRARWVAKGLISLAAGVACFFLARVFFLASLRAQDRPLEYNVLTDWGDAHICTAPPSLIAEYDLARPDLFCSFRWVLDQLGVQATESDGTLLQVETPVGALQLIVPVLFAWMAIRFGARAIGSGIAFARDELPVEARPAAISDAPPEPASSDEDDELDRRKTEKMKRVPKKGGKRRKGRKKKRRR